MYDPTLPIYSSLHAKSPGYQLPHISPRHWLFYPTTKEVINTFMIPLYLSFPRGTHNHRVVNYSHILCPTPPEHLMLVLIIFLQTEKRAMSHYPSFPIYLLWNTESPGFRRWYNHSKTSYSALPEFHFLQYWFYSRFYERRPMSPQFLIHYLFKATLKHTGWSITQTNLPCTLRVNACINIFPRICIK